LIIALPGNSPVNTAQHATIDEVVFSMSFAPSSGGTMGLCNPFLSNGSLNTLPRKRWRQQQQRRFPWGLCRVFTRAGSDRIRSGQLRVSRKLEEWLQKNF
jgi:hypothetical protein